MIEAFKQVEEGSWREFAAYQGGDIDSLVAWDKLALVGDSSHPSIGNSTLP